MGSILALIVLSMLPCRLGVIYQQGNAHLHTSLFFQQYLQGYNAQSPLVVFQDTVTARSYVHSILMTVVLPTLSCRPAVIYQQGNVHSHTSLFSQQYLQGYNVLPCPVDHQASRQ